MKLLKIMTRLFGLGTCLVVGVACSDGDGSTDGAGGASAGDDAPLVINELMASNQTTAFDEFDEADDWIELYNPTDEDVSVAGYFLSDKADNPTKAVLPDVTVPAGGVLLLWADDDTEQGALHLPFKLSAAGEGVYLTGPSGALLDSVTYESAAGDESLGRSEDGAGEFVWCAVSTPSELNGSNCAP